MSRAAQRVSAVLAVILLVLVTAIVAVVISRPPPAQQPVGALPDTPVPTVGTFSPTSSTPIASVATSPPATGAGPTAAPGRTRKPRPTPSATATLAVATPTASPSATATATPSSQPTLPTDATIDDALARCPTLAEIEFVDARLDLVFFDDITAPELVCRASDGSADLTRLQERAYQAVLTMRRIEFDAPLPWTDRSLFGWLTHAVLGIAFSSTTQFSYCCDADHIVIRSASDMGFLQDNRWDAPDELGGGMVSLIGLIAHEARHAEGYPHTCNYNEEADGYADDQTIEEMGAWAINILVYEWIAEHADPGYMRPADGPPDFYLGGARDSADRLTQLRICSVYEN